MIHSNHGDRTDWNLSRRCLLYVEPEFSSILSDVYGCRQIVLPLDIGGQRVPAFHVKRPFCNRVVLAPFNFQPVLKDLNTSIVDEIVRSASGISSGTTARIRLHHPLPRDVIDRHGLTVTNESVETLISLLGGIEAVLKNMRPRQRTKWRKVNSSPQQSEFVVSALEDTDSLREFYDLLVRVYRDKHRMLPQPLSLFQRFYSMPHRRSRGTKGYIARSKTNGKVLAGIVVFMDEIQWTYAWGASEQDDLAPLDLSTLLIGIAIKDAIAAGASLFSLGASPLSHETLRQFKRGWGGEEHEILTYYWRESPAEVDFHHGFPIAKRLVEQVPLPILKGLSPLAVKWLV